MAQATFSCPFGAIHLEDRRGTAQDGHFVSIFAYPTPSVASRHLPLTGGVGPRSPITGVTPWVRQSISGAQNLSSNLNSRRPTGAFVVADFVSLASPDWAKLAHSIAPPLQRKPAALGFALGPPAAAYLGGKLRLVRFQSRAWLCRAGGGRSVVGGPVWDRPLQKGRTPLHML